MERVLKNVQRQVRDVAAEDVRLIVGYFHNADTQFLRGMGVDPAKMPDPDCWMQTITDDLNKPPNEKQFHYLIWEIDGQPAGHSNINKIVYGDNARMHLHLWQSDKRQSGNGSWFVRESLRHYFELFVLQKLFCEPCALNPAPNKTLPKCGFSFVEQYEGIPGWINYHQQVNRWVLRREDWLGGR